MTDSASRSDERRRAAQAFYGALSAHPDASRRVGWESPAAHRLRQLAIAEALAPLEGLGALIDAGCGEAALLATLRAAGFRGRYLGEDVLAAPIARAQAAGDPLASFEVTDSFAEGGRTAPAVVCSGALNTVSGAVDHDVEVQVALAALWRRAEEVLVVDVAVADRHPPGVGLARCDLGKLWAHARTLAPVVLVREDVVPGEALLVLAHSRLRAFARRAPDPMTLAEALLLAGEPGPALALARPLQGAPAALLVGQALAALGSLREALTALEEAVAKARAEGHEAVLDAARLAQAPVLWRLGDRRAAEALLEDLARHHDEARAHLFELVLGRRDHARASALLEAIEDTWVRRELARKLAALR